MSVILGFGVLLQAMMATPAATGAELCAGAAWREAFGEQRLTCVATKHGAVIAPPERAEALAPIIDAAAARYAIHFGLATQPIVVVPGSSISAPQMQFLQQRGFLGLAWPVDSRWEAGALAHEIAHNWFTAWYDSGHPGRMGLEYGSTAPDWLDETVAVLNEDRQLTASRRAGFADLLDGDGPQLRPLPEFLAMIHPRAAATSKTVTYPNNLLTGPTPKPDGATSVPAAPGKGTSTSTDTSASTSRSTSTSTNISTSTGTSTSASTESFALSGPEDAAVAGKVLAFYTQSRAFADFLIEKTRDPRIMATIATQVRNGLSFEQWLGTFGPRYGLPCDLPGLSEKWESWLQKNTRTERSAF